MAQTYGIGTIPWSPLAGGLLGGALQKASEGRRSSERAQENVEKNRAKLEAWEGFCRELGEQPADVALAWLLNNPVVTAPIIGPRTMDQLTDALAVLEQILDDDLRTRLDALNPPSNAVNDFHNSNSWMKQRITDPPYQEA